MDILKRNGTLDESASSVAYTSFISGSDNNLENEIILPRCKQDISGGSFDSNKLKGGSLIKPSSYDEENPKSKRSVQIMTNRDITDGSIYGNGYASRIAFTPPTHDGDNIKCKHGLTTFNEETANCSVDIEETSVRPVSTSISPKHGSCSISIKSVQQACALSSEFQCPPVQTVNKGSLLETRNKTIKGAKTSDHQQKHRILALSGTKKADEVIKLQLDNLQITHKHYDIFYFNGSNREGTKQYKSPEVEDLPLYQWFCKDHTDASFRPSLLQAASEVWKVIETMGPFDSVYGFSQGASVATIVAGSSNDDVLWNALVKESSKAGIVLKKDSIIPVPFKYMVLVSACDLPTSARVDFSGGGLDKLSICIPSLHLIGIDDFCRPISEDISRLFSDTQVKYIDSGLDLSKSTTSDSILLHSIHDGLNTGTNAITIDLPEMIKVSDISSIGVIPDFQTVLVNLDGERHKPTIIKALEESDPQSPFLYNARGFDSSNVTNYGNVLEFIRDGPGDLRRLGIKPTEIVAYCAPDGATSVLAFLSIASQTTAAPLAPTTSEFDTLSLLELYDAKHLIVFNNIDCPGVESASKKLSKNGKISIHIANVHDSGKPGWFNYSVSEIQTLNPTLLSSGLPLRNPSRGIALLLATSGTTSKPKAVPLLHGSILRNGHIIAKSLGLKESDICYNIMPLFHIGGISSSILSTLTSGGAICCDDKAFDPEGVVDALALSNPQPTWYSAAPIIHNLTVSFIKSNAYSAKLMSHGINKDGVWNKGHSLRFIRSGAAALLQSDAAALATTYGNISVYLTYSMSEQMPISQPPNSKYDKISHKEGSVGVPIAASLAIVNISNLRVNPYGKEGEVAISGPTVMANYFCNLDADRKAYFELTLPIGSSSKFAHNRFFLTGDIGLLERDGCLTLKGRNKELIKKDGEQVSPFEIEEIFTSHFLIEIALCFSVQSELNGEEIGCALVLSNLAAVCTRDEVIRQMRELLWISKLIPLKWPTKWSIVQESDLPKTKSNKYIRIGLGKILGMEKGQSENTIEELSVCTPKDVDTNALIDWNVISGLRFFLAFYVMFMHVGSTVSLGAFNNLRGFPWHVHCFFTLGGFSLAAPMSPIIEKKFKYFLARISQMYPMYIVAVLFTLANLLVSCRPSTFRPEFHWSSQPDDLYIDGDKEKGISSFFCEGTPVTPNSYWASLCLTIIVYVFGILITPMWVLSWWMGYYFWFASMYYQCLMVFPSLYNRLLFWRGNISQFLKLVVILLGVNYAILICTWFGVKNAQGYKSHESEKEVFMHNAVDLGWYLFSPFWMIYFVLGGCTAFLYDAYRPADQVNSKAWGIVADGCTCVILIWSICIVTQGTGHNNLRPSEADEAYMDVAATYRIWDSIHGRIFAPITTLWIFSLSTGRGYTASVFRLKIFVQRMSPHSYNCFLFHQMIAQWYYAATRRGLWWNWWQYRKTMYWFSPQPVPVRWYELFIVVILTVAFSNLMQVTLEPIATAVMIFIKRILFSDLFVDNMFADNNEYDLDSSVHTAIGDITGLIPQNEWTLGQSGLSSVGLPQLASRLSGTLSTKSERFSITARELSSVETVGDIINVLSHSVHQRQSYKSRKERNAVDMLSQSSHI